MEENHSIVIDHINDDKLLPISKLINTIISDHMDSLLNNKNKLYSSIILELIIHLELYDVLKTYLNNCITYEMQFHDSIFRDDHNGIKALDRFVQICLDKFFDKNINNHLLGNLFVICSNAPKILRDTCLILFNEGVAKKDDSFAYRTICSLIVFRYYLGQIIPRNITNETVILECKTIKQCANFEKFSDPIMMSLVKILISNDVGGGLEFKLSNKEIISDLEMLISFFDELIITGELQEELKEQKLKDVRQLLESLQSIDGANNKHEHVSQPSDRRKKFIKRKSYSLSFSLKPFNITSPNYSKDIARKSNSAGTIETPRQ